MIISLILTILYLLMESLLFYFYCLPKIKDIQKQIRLKLLAHQMLFYWKSETLRDAFIAAEPKAKADTLEEVMARLRTLYPFDSFEILLFALQNAKSFNALKKVVDYLFPIESEETYEKNLQFIHLIYIVQYAFLLLMAQNSYVLEIFQSFIGVLYFSFALTSGFLVILYLTKKKEDKKMNQFFLYFTCYGQVLKPYEAFENACKLLKNFGETMLERKLLFIEGSGKALQEAFSSYDEEDKEKILMIASALKDTRITYEYQPILRKEESISFYPFILCVAFFLFYLYGVYFL